jgi:hypothetical protein
MIIGHLAISVLESHYLDTDMGPTIAGGLFPDALDKSLCQVLAVSAHGRLWGHTVLGFALSTLIVGAARGKRAAGSWALGYVSHLLADLEAPVPLFHPFAAYAMPESPSITETLHRFATDPTKLLPELALAIWAIGVLVRSRRDTEPMNP